MSPVQKKKAPVETPKRGGPTSPRRSSGSGQTTGDSSGAPEFTTPQQLADPLLVRDEKTKKRETHEYKRMEGKLFKWGVRETDVMQGWMSNCYFGAALGAVAQRHPDKIREGIKEKGGDVFSVRLYSFDKWGTPTAHWVDVDADFPWYKDKNTWAYMQSMQKGELWPSLAEKAYAVFKSRTRSNPAGDYEKIGQGGYESDVLEAFTGLWAEEHGTKDESEDRLWERLKRASDKGKAMTAGTYSPKLDASGSHNDPRYGDKTKIWENHAYTVLGVQEVGRGRGKKRMVKLRNPWGESEPGQDGKNDGVFMIPLKQFIDCYESMTILD